MANLQFFVIIMCVVLTMHLICDTISVKGVVNMATTNITIRMDEELKKQAEDLFSDLGLNMSSAIIAFTKQAVREQRIPFELTRRVPNEETLQAIAEVNDMKRNPDKYKGYTDVDEMMRDILK